MFTNPQEQPIRASSDKTLDLNKIKQRLSEIEILKSKIHNVKVTQTELHYVGSLTLDEDLMDASNLIENEKVLVVNNNNGERLETYIIKGERGSKIVCLNGAAARKAQVGDILIVIAFAYMDFEVAKNFKPALAFVNPDNSLL